MYPLMPWGSTTTRIADRTPQVAPEAVARLVIAVPIPAPEALAARLGTHVLEEVAEVAPAFADPDSPATVICAGVIRWTGAPRDHAGLGVVRGTDSSSRMSVLRA